MQGITTKHHQRLKPRPRSQKTAFLDSHSQTIPSVSLLAGDRLGKVSLLASCIWTPLVCQSELHTGVSSYLGLCASYVVTNVMNAS